MLVNTRMEKYNSEKPTLKRRTDKNRELYEQINNQAIGENFDLNSNMTVLNTDSRVIDVDKIRDMLDRKYRNDDTKKHIVLPEMEDTEVELSNTKEYDINSVLEKAKKNKNFDYEKERLKSIHNTQYDILKKLDVPGNDVREEAINDDEENLVNLINTITALELKNRNNKKKHEEAFEMLSDFKEEDNASIEEDKNVENTFTNNKILDFQNNDYEDFEDLKNDIKSNSILIKIVVILFVLILLVGSLMFANNYFDLGLF